jgi:GAF domain-containing protein
MNNKAELYRTLFQQLKSLIVSDENQISNMANFSAAMKSSFGFLWVGFYLVQKEQLILGPFQGPVACTRIKKNKGVCGTSWARKKTIIANNVHDFPDYISCNGEANSEMVIPIVRDGEIFGVLDIDSTELNYFDDVDQTWLEKICKWFAIVIS